MSGGTTATKVEQGVRVCNGMGLNLEEVGLNSNLSKLMHNKMLLYLVKFIT